MNTNLISRCLILILSCTTIFLLRSHSFHEPLETDEAFLAVSAHNWLEGAKPDVTFTVDRPIGSYIIYRIAITMFGYDEQAPKLLASLSIFLTAFGLLVILCSYDLYRDTVLLLMILWALFSCLPTCHINGSTIEVFVIPLLTILYIFLQRYQKSGNDFLYWGAIFLLIASFTITYITLPFFVIPFIIGFQCHWKNWKTLFRRIGFSALIFWVCHVFIYWLNSYSVLELYLQFKGNILQIVTIDKWSLKKFIRTIFLIPFDNAVSIITYPIIFAYVGTIAKSIKNNHPSGLVLSYFLLAAIFSIALPGSNSPHYYILLVPFVILGMGLFCDSLSKRSSSLVGLVFFISFYSFYLYNNYLIKLPNEISYSKFNQNNGLVRDRFIGLELLNRKLTGMQTFVSGNHPGIYFYSQNLPAAKFSFNWNDNSKRVSTWEDIMHELQKNPPELCIFPDAVEPRVNSWLDQNYILQESIANAKVYRLIKKGDFSRF